MGLYIRANTAKKRGTPKRKSLDEKSKRELIKVLDKVFSEYIRLERTDCNGYGFCVTCGSMQFWRDFDCGHFIPRAREAARYDPANVGLQCRKCNRFRSGEHDLFRSFLVNEYGKEAVEQMELRSRLGGGYDAYQLREMISEYREKVKTLKKEKGLR